jgi:hypothetical protein
MTKWLRLFAITASCTIAFFTTSANADTLNFTELDAQGVNPYNTGRTELTLSNAKISTTSSELYYAPSGGFLEANDLGSISAFGNVSVAGNLEILFDGPVENLKFGTFGWSSSPNGTHDRYRFTAFNGSNLVYDRTLDYVNDLLGITLALDLSSFGHITRLVFDPTNSWDGIVFNDFSFGTVPVSAVPLPMAFPLFAAALGGLGLFGWRRKKSLS